MKECYEVVKLSTLRMLLKKYPAIAGYFYACRSLLRRISHHVIPVLFPIQTVVHRHVAIVPIACLDLAELHPDPKCKEYTDDERYPSPDPVSAVHAPPAVC